MESIIYQIKTKVFHNNNQLMKINTCQTYADLRRVLSSDKKYAIQQSTQLNYMDDLGDLKIIDNENSYKEFLSCSNGLCHYIEINYSGEIKKISSDWQCTYCFTKNNISLQTCGVCKKLKFPN